MSENLPPVPLRWRLRWFCQGIGSIFGIAPSVDQVSREIRMCAEEMAKNNPKTERIIVARPFRKGTIICEFDATTDFQNLYP